MEKKFLFNSRIVDEAQASILVSLKSAFFGYGVYESIRVFAGKPFYPRWHLERLIASGRAIGIEIPYSEKELEKMLSGLIAANDVSDALVRLLYYGPTEKDAGVLVGFPLGFHFYPDKTYSQGMKAITYAYERLLPQAKTLDLLGGFLALREATKKDCVEALFVDRNCCITEGTRSNFFIVDEKGKLATAPKADVLEGITRKVLLDNLPGNIFLEERKVALEDLVFVKEAFATSTVFGVMPLVQINGKKIGDGKVGQITRQLGKIYDSHVKEYCAQSASKPS